MQLDGIARLVFLEVLRSFGYGCRLARDDGSFLFFALAISASRKYSGSSLKLYILYAIAALLEDASASDDWQVNVVRLHRLIIIAVD